MYSKRYPDRILLGKPDKKPAENLGEVKTYKATPEQLAELDRILGPVKKDTWRPRPMGRMTWKKSQRQGEEKKPDEVSLDSVAEDEEQKAAADIDEDDEENCDMFGNGDAEEIIDEDAEDGGAEEDDGPSSSKAF